jgi:hypothetical protein
MPAQTAGAVVHHHEIVAAAVHAREWDHRNCNRPSYQC